MTPEQQRIAIAEACGWRCAKHVAEFDKIHATMCWIKPSADEWQTQELPDYLKDLNAMHEAEKYLDDEQWLEYMLNLQDVLCRNPDRSKWTVCRDNMSATAHQRAVAFLKTLNLWEQ